MMNGIHSVTGVSDQTPDRRSPKRDGQGAEPSVPHAEPETAPAPGADLRLLIEPGADGASYVYKLVDRATGEVVAERPQDQVAHLAEGPEYRAGTVVSTKA